MLVLKDVNFSIAHRIAGAKKEGEEGDLPSEYLSSSLAQQAQVSIFVFCFAYVDTSNIVQTLAMACRRPLDEC